jgi:hypothetical protein
MIREEMLLPRTLYVKGLSPYGPYTSGSSNHLALLTAREDVITFIYIYSCLLKALMQNNKCNYDLQTPVQVLYCSLFSLYCFGMNSICSLALTQLSPIYLANCSCKNVKEIPVTGRGGL